MSSRRKVSEIVNGKVTFGVNREKAKPCKSCEDLEYRVKWANVMLILMCMFALLFLISFVYEISKSKVQIPEGYKIVNVSECHNETNAYALGYGGVGQDFNYSYVMCSYCYDGRIKENDECNINCNKRVRQMIEDNTKTICTPTDKLYTETCESYYIHCADYATGYCSYKRGNWTLKECQDYMLSVNECERICTKKLIQIEVELE